MSNRLKNRFRIVHSYEFKDLDTNILVKNYYDAFYFRWTLELTRRKRRNDKYENFKNLFTI